MHKIDKLLISRNPQVLETYSLSHSFHSLNNLSFFSVLHNHKISGSTMLNLSLLTSDMWAVLIRIFAYHQKVDWMYFIAFGAVAVGLVIYSGINKKDENIAQVAEAKERDEESGLNNLVQQSTTTSRDLRPGDVKQQCSTSGDVAK